MVLEPKPTVARAAPAARRAPEPEGEVILGGPLVRRNMGQVLAVH